MGTVVKMAESYSSPATEGLHAGRMIDEIDLGMVETQWGTKHRVELRFVIDEDDAKNVGKKIVVSNRYTLSLDKKATLRKTLEAWLGAAAIKPSMDLGALIGTAAYVLVKNNTSSQGKVFSNIDGLLPLPKGMTAPGIPVDYVRRGSDDNDEAEAAPVAVAAGAAVTDADIPF